MLRQLDSGGDLIPLPLWLGSSPTGRGWVRMIIGMVSFPCDYVVHVFDIEAQL
jgi:hypothetical protein